MSRLNIGTKEVQGDIAYRYKMDRIQTKIEGRGNGIKTVLTNMGNIGAQMKTDPRYITKYVGIERGAQSNWDKARDVGIVNGSFPADVIQNDIQGFIELFVLCPFCKLPELQHKIREKKGVVAVRCMSCGETGKIRSVHNVMKFILKNPPSKSKVKGPGGRDGKKQKRLERERRRQQEKAGDQQLQDGESGRPEAEKKRDVLQIFGGDLSCWYMDPDSTRCQGERANQRALEDEMLRNHSKKLVDTPVALLEFILSKPNVKLTDIVSEFERIKTAHQLENQEVKLGKVLVDAVFGFDFESQQQVMDCIEKHKMLLGWYASDETRACILMSHIERGIVNNADPDFKKFTSKLFEAFYDAGIFDEPFFLDWFDQPPESSYIVKDPDDIKALKDNAEPFIEWVQSIYQRPKASDDEAEHDDGEIEANLEEEQQI